MLRRSLALVLLAVAAITSTSGCTASRFDEVELDPNKPIMSFTPLDSIEGGERRHFGKVSLIVPAGYEVRETEGYGGAKTIFITAPGADAHSLMVDMQPLPGVDEEHLAIQLWEGLDQLRGVHQISHNSLGYAEWPGLEVVTVHRSTREYERAQSGDFLGISTFDKENTLLVHVVFSAPVGERETSPYQEILRTLQIR